MNNSPSNAEVRAALFDRNNWGRWGDADERGAMNLITPESRLAAIGSVRSGQTLSLARTISTVADANNPEPAQHWMRFWHNGGESAVTRPDDVEPGGWAVDFYGVSYHGFATTHLDAISHVWDEQGMYNGRDPHEHVTPDGATFGGVEHWASDIVTRGVLLDVPAHRGGAYVTADTPVHGSELEQIVAAQGSELHPGDALCVYSGREAWQRDNPSTPYGMSGIPRAGLHASCLDFLRDNDLSLLGWDMLDNKPWDYDVAFTTHGVIWAYGMALVDNMILEDLAAACAKRGAYDFLLVVAPLVVKGGTGSPVNPIAIL